MELKCSPRDLAIGTIALVGLAIATVVAAGGLGAAGVALVLLPVAMVAYSYRLTAIATAHDRDEIAAIEQANADLRRFVVGETSTLVGIAREQQAAIHAGYSGAIRAALEVVLQQARPDAVDALTPEAQSRRSLSLGGW
jgi:hypothetical protein